MDEVHRAKGPGIQFNRSVQVSITTAFMKTVDYDDEENWFRCQEDDDDDEDDYETPVNLHTGNL